MGNRTRIATVLPKSGDDMKASPEGRYGSRRASSVFISVSSVMVAISDALTVLKITLVLSWAVTVSSSSVGRWVASTKNTPYFRPSWAISVIISLVAASRPFGAKL